MNATSVRNHSLDPTRIGSDVDQLCDRFEESWRAGARPVIEAFLDGTADSQRPVLLRYLLLVELEYRARLGESPERSEYQFRFPDCEKLVGSVFAEFARRFKVGHGADPETVELGTQSDRASLALAARTPSDSFPSIPGCEILSELGRGGMGIVYKARQVRLDRICAVKIALPETHNGAEARTRFLAEAEMIARLRHTNLVQIYSLGEHNGRAYFEMEYIEGGSLADRLDGTPWPPEPAARMVAVLARAIGEAHRLGIVHRDLKPANVLLTADEIPKVVDFGLAKSLEADSHLTQSGVFIGTPSYAAPEQVAGSNKAVGPPADIYALGAIFYHLLTGRPPFQGPTVLCTMEQVRSADPVPPSRLQPGLPRDAETIALKCLEKDPQRRYADAAALAEDLDRYLCGRPILARPSGAAERLLKWARRRPAVVGLAATVVAVTVLCFVLVSWQWRRAEAKAVAAAAANERAQQAHLDALEEQAELTFHQALALCDQGEVGRGLTWLARGLELATEAHSQRLDRPIRINLADWASQLIRPVKLPSMRHPGPVLTMAFRREGGALVSVGHDGVVRFWSTATGREDEKPLKLDEQPAVARLERVQLGTGESSLLTAVDDRERATAWDLNCRRRLATPRMPVGPELRQGSPVEVVALTPSSRTVITARCGGRLHVRDTTTQRAFDLPPQGTEVISLAVSPDGRVFASGTEGGVVRLWDTSSLAQIGQTCKFSGAVTAIAFGPDGRLLAIGEEDGTIRLSELPRQKALGFPLPVNDPVLTMTFDRTGERVLVGTTEGVRWWDLSRKAGCERCGGIKQANDRPTSRVGAATVSPDSRTMATARYVRDGDRTCGRVEIRDLATGKILRRTPDQPHRLVGVAFSPDSKWLLAWGSAPKTATLWSAANLRESRPLFRSLGCSVHQAEFSPDGQSVLLGCRDGKARLWNLERDVEINAECRPRHAYPITAVAFDTERSRFVTGCHAGTVRFWDITGGTLLNELRQNAGEVGVLAFSPDGRMMLTASHDGTARFLDAETGRQLGPALRHTDAVLCVAFHPDGRSVVTGTRDGMVHRFSVPLPPETGAAAEIERRVTAQTGIKLDCRRAEPIETLDN
jgi:WD40 repeat protein/predicted Ser/Thr protein kinase